MYDAFSLPIVSPTMTKSQSECPRNSGNILCQNESTVTAGSSLLTTPKRSSIVSARRDGNRFPKLFPSRLRLARVDVLTRISLLMWGVTLVAPWLGLAIAD